MRGKIQDRSIVTRFSPVSLAAAQEFAAQKEDGGFWWTTSRAGAWVFESHEEAEAFAGANLYEAQWAESLLKPWAIVCGDRESEENRERRRMSSEAMAESSVRDVELVEDGARRMAPAECYEVTSRRMGEREEVGS